MFSCQGMFRYMLMLRVRQMGHRDGPWPGPSKTNGIRKIVLIVMGREHGPWPVNSASKEIQKISEANAMDFRQNR